ncbi:hypothetical protein HU200_063604 [Digitaria exilis]|uniref:Uncharacterized protein n=1 Tax=Digitaria exilis TaxID=1010633 RepID=A0A835DV84_9POAL|nr:hypothetical protein HU200_063604 [Digitaria exilis]
MRTSNLAFAALLLLLLLLATKAHGIRLDKQLHETINSKQMGDPKSSAGEASIAADLVKSRHCTPDGRCSGTTEQMTPTPVVAKDSEVMVVISSTGNGHTATVDSAAAASRRVGRQRRATYPDLMDIAGMDYSPAARKPPIHN